MSGSIKQIKTTGSVSLSKFNLSKRQNLQTLTVASWQDSMSRGPKNGENFLTSYIDFFVYFFAICRE